MPDNDRNTARLAWRGTALACLIILCGFFMVYFHFVMAELNGDMDTLATGKDVSAYTTALYPNLLYGPMFVLATLVTHGLIRRCRPRTDPLLYPCVVFLAGLGFLVLYRLAPDLGRLEGKQSLISIARQHFFWLSCGYVVMGLVVTFIRRDHAFGLARQKYIYFVVGAGLILATWKFGTPINDRKLWLQVGALTIQTIEPVKLLFAIGLAAFFADCGLYFNYTKLLGVTLPGRRYFVPFVVMTGISILPVFLQKDLGPTVLLALMFIAALAIGTGLRFMPLLATALLPLAGWLAYVTGFPSMAKTRITIWLEPFGYGEGMVRAFWAMASGGLWGTGLGAGRPQDIPVVQSDFNLVAIGEELGFIGAAAVVLVFLAMIYRGAKLAVGIDDLFAKFMVSFLTLMVGLQALVIMCCNTGLLPMTGITLPFLSLGGTSLLVNFLMMGLVIALSDLGD